MRIFVAGASGVIGRRLVPLLVKRGHRVTGMTRTPDKVHAIRAMGAEPVCCDVFDAEKLNAAMADAKPEAVVHQMTAIPERLDPRKIEEMLAPTNRLRSEGTRVLARAAESAGVQIFLAQSVAFGYQPQPGLAGEDAPLYTDAPEKFVTLTQAILDLELTTTTLDGIRGIVLRYGYFYGPGTVYAPEGSFAAQVKQRNIPVIGDGDGVFSFIHVDDAARATLAALERGQPGIYNIVDDEPIRFGDWLPAYAEALGAKKPLTVPTWLGRLGAGEYGVYMMNEIRGASNERAKRELGWAPKYPGWRDGFDQ